MRGGELGGFLVRGFYDEAALACINRRLDEDRLPGGEAFPRKDLPGFEHLAQRPFLYGHSLVDTDPALGAYFRDAGASRAALRALFEGLEPFEVGIERLLSTLSGAPASLPAGPDGEPYCPATLRQLPEGHEIGLHIGNAFLCTPQSRHLGQSVEVGAQLSFFTPLRCPEGGGELVIYNLRWEMVAAAHRGGAVEIRQVSASAVRFAELCAQVRYAPEPGDMMVFDGGRYYHRVTAVEGKVPRRTLGGFLAWSLDGRRVHYWS